MNFSESIKREILSKSIKDKHCKKAFLAGLIRGNGVLFEREEELGVEFKVPDESTVALLSSILYSLFNYELREVSVTTDKVSGKDKFILSISGSKAEEILSDLGVLYINGEDLVVNLNFYGKITERECCLKAFIRGLFVSSGRCTLPTENGSSSTGYHLEISFSHYQPALDTLNKLLEVEINARITKRRDGYILYIKSVEDIKDFIAYLPAPVSVLKLTDLMINRELNNRSNRQKNCDLGNVNKQVEASSKQISAIEKIEKTIGLSSLKPDLELTAKARRDNPEETLLELSERLNVSKSCLNHRLRKILLIAKEL